MCYDYFPLWIPLRSLATCSASLFTVRRDSMPFMVYQVALSVDHLHLSIMGRRVGAILTVLSGAHIKLEFGKYCRTEPIYPRWVNIYIVLPARNQEPPGSFTR